MSSVISRILNPVYNILARTEAMNRPAGFTPAFESAPSAPSYSAAAGRSTSPFIIGFLPPDLRVEFVPPETVKAVVSRDAQTLPASTKPKTAGGTTQPGTAASPIKRVGGIPSTPGELQRSQTTISKEQMKTAVYNELVRRGLSAERATFLTPYICSQAATEIKYDGANGGQFSTFNFNIGNVHAGSSGKYRDPAGPKDPSNWAVPPTPPKGGAYALGTDTEKGVPYPVYFKAADSLEAGVSNFIGTLAGAYPKTLQANSPAEYVAALRPDLNGGPPNKAYFTAPVEDYERGVRAKLTWFGGKVDPNAKPSIVNSGTNANVPLTNFDIRSMAAGATNTNENDPLADKLGRNIRVDNTRQEAVRKQNAAINAQIDQMDQTPSLLMLVNPKDFKKAYAHKRDIVTARRGPQVHIWTEEPVKISCSGKSAAQYALNQTKDGGLTGTQRIYSLSYQNLMSLFSIYKNNGHIYTDDSFGEGNSGIRHLAAAVFIYFDGIIYIGSFDNFSLPDSADSPFNMEYSFSFTVRYEIEAQGVSDSDILASLQQVIAT